MLVRIQPLHPFTIFTFAFASVAQWIEQELSKLLVVGSNPTWGATSESWSRTV